ncbi:MAG: hypothetical protein U0174_08955 [Polyangiaceae bacterium]
MKYVFGSFSAAVALVFATNDVWAKDDPVSGEAKVIVPSPVVPAVSPTPAAPVAPVTAERCFLVEEVGVPHDQANFAAKTFCHALLERDRAPDRSYGVRIAALGSRVVVVGEQRSAAGVITARKEIAMTGLEESFAAAPRLAEALVNDKKVEDTANLQTILSDESRSLKTRGGRMGYEGGVMGTTAFGFAAIPSAGAFTGVQYESLSRLAVKLEARAGGIGSAPSVGSASLDVGGRYYTSPENVSPYFGGGLGFAYFSNTEKGIETTRYGSYETRIHSGGAGFNGYLSGGVQFMRLERVSLDVGARVDVPAFAVTANFGDGASQQRYMVPVSLNLGMTFH